MAKKCLDVKFVAKACLVRHIWLNTLVQSMKERNHFHVKYVANALPKRHTLLSTSVQSMKERNHMHVIFVTTDVL